MPKLTSLSTGPILLGIPIGTTEAEADAESDEVQPWRDLPCHKDEDQVQLDVNRAFTYYPIGEIISSPPFSDLLSPKCHAD